MEHIPVLLNEVIELLSIKEDGIYLDLTLGRAGHSREILSKLTSGRLICLDQDEVALEESRKILETISDRFTLVHSNYSKVKEVLEELHIEKVDGILADLGVSSPQLDDVSRGFSYRFDSPLDMRMDLSQSLTAKTVVNTYSYEDLVRILYLYGEESDAKKIARNIVKQREIHPINTTFELVDIVKKSKSSKDLEKKGHPAKQTFQAIRMEVNKEKQTLEQMLLDAPTLLKSKGRMAVITFMSSDDRLVKSRFNELSKEIGSRHGPFLIEQTQKEFVLVNKKVITPSEEELSRNHRAASAKLRVIERR
ncbi:MAG: 16S rRNA (cytosine(1402)-N(4))-methyltransferase RsmH [Bacilli bacterium]|nr:16S rRNA (cytosine(1402)-N(4))-methyltransferase RsmH [Bacilli bacterium]MDY6430574.1 16S rRNA (cytosine(1402)-N(4))-methyltransferase RsmH [Bacilli bacterium]